MYLSSIISSGAPPSISVFSFNTRLIPKFSYKAQLTPLPNDLFKDEEKTYHWIEIFENKKSHETHFKQEATQDFFEFMGPLFDGKPDFKTFESV